MPRDRWPKPARAAFEAKIVVLESWARAGAIPENAPTLSTIKDVRMWSDPAKGLTTWSSYSVAAPSGEHADLRARLDAVLPLIATIRKGSVEKPRKPRRGKPVPQIQTERERDRLAVQNEVLLAECDSLRAEVTRLRQLLALKGAEHQELLARYNKLAPFGKR